MIGSISLVVAAICTSQILVKPSYLDLALNYLDSSDAVLKNNLFLNGNYAPVDELEKCVENLTVDGNIPLGIDGSYLRIGPNPAFEPLNRYHWFDGDGMIHGVKIKNGKATYCNSYLETPKLQKEREKGHAIWTSVLSLENGFPSAFVFLLESLREKLGVIEKLPFTTAHTANTNIINWAKKNYALVEADYPFEFKIQKDGDIKSVGYEQFDDKLHHGMTAHPKRDFHTNEMFFFCAYNDTEESPLIRISSLDNEGKKRPSIEIPLLSREFGGSFMHDTAITENYLILIDSSSRLDPKRVFMGEAKQFINFNKDAPVRFGLIKRNELTTAKEAIWYSLNIPGMIFHVCNAFEKNGKVHLFVSFHNEFHISQLSGFNFKPEFNHTHAEPREIIVNFEESKAGEKEGRSIFANGSEIDKVRKALNSEFPRINDHFMGYENKFVYLAARGDAPDVSFSELIKYNLETQKAEHVKLNGLGGEIAFIPKAKDVSEYKNGLKEDDGYLITLVYDPILKISFCKIFNAQSLKLLASINLKSRVPFGFHSEFVESRFA